MRLYRQDIGEFTQDEYILLLETLPQKVTAYLSKKALVDDRKRTLVGILLAYTAARECCGAKAPDLCYTPAGKPYFPDLPLQFSIAHAEDRVLCAASDRPIGVDVEKLRPVDLRLAGRFFTPAERDFVGGDPARFLEVWTKKEAYAKWRGNALAEAFGVDTTTLSFTTETDGEYIWSVYEE